MTAIERFVQYERYELNRSPHTVAAYRGDLEQFRSFLSRDGADAVEWGTVSVTDVRAWLVNRADAGDCARTLRRRVQSVRAFYQWLMREGAVADNPAAEVELARLPRRLPQYVREQNLNTLLDTPVDASCFEAVRDHLVVALLYETGIRRAELIGLLDAAVDVSQGVLRVHGKRDKDRVVPFGPELGRWITHYRELRDATVAVQTPALLVTSTGRAMYPSLVYRIVHDNLASVGGSDRMSPHVLRHSFATAMLNHGAELNSVKELLGHESLAATQVYTHVTLSELKHNYELAHPRASKK
jgi:integrase/recombinase XerC